MSDKDLTMAVDTTFNAILKGIQISKLNFLINITPYGAYITLKKSALLDINGIRSLPSPPTSHLLEESMREKRECEVEVDQLTAELFKSEQKREILEQKNNSLHDSLTQIEDQMKSLIKTNDAKDIEVSKLKSKVNKLEADLSAFHKKHNEFTVDSNCQVSALKKSIKMKEKENYNLNTQLNNSLDTITNMKHELGDVKKLKVKLEKDVRRMEKKIVKLEIKKEYQTISSQTLSVAEPPFLIDPLKMFDGDVATFSHDVKKKAGAAMVNLEDVGACDDVDMASTMRCKVCCLPFKSEQDLRDHNDAYPYCCWQCLVCYETLKEAQNHDC